MTVVLGLASVPLTPLRTGQWLLLAIGLSQVAVPLAAIVVVWLLALGLRERHGAGLVGYRFNLGQIGLGLLSVAVPLLLISHPPWIIGSPTDARCRQRFEFASSTMVR